MSLKFCSENFIINKNDFIKFFNYNGKLFEPDFEWEMALRHFFKNIIFHSTYTLDTNGSSKSIIYYPFKKKTYLLNSDEVEYFKNKYFLNFDLIDRSPDFFSFQIPFPKIYFFLENSKLNNEDQYNISIGRYKSQTYKNIENYTLRIDSKSIESFDSIFQKDFITVYNLTEDYKSYLKSIMGIESSLISTKNLIKPFYLLSQNELEEIKVIEGKIMEEHRKQDIRDNDEKMDKEYGKWFDSEMNDLNRQAFENDPDNYWNID
jgi:hypothetical protein